MTLEQSQGRAFASCEGIITHNPQLAAEAEVLQKNIFLDNGTEIVAISSDYAVGKRQQSRLGEL